MIFGHNITTTYCEMFQKLYLWIIIPIFRPHGVFSTQTCGYSFFKHHFSYREILFDITVIMIYKVKSFFSNELFHSRAAYFFILLLSNRLYITPIRVVMSDYRVNFSPTCIFNSKQKYSLDSRSSTFLFFLIID